MGWNGVETYGVRVDSARNADTVAGLAVAGARNNAANQIVRTDASGYIQTDWVNTTSGQLSETDPLNKIYVSNDNYIRYVTPEQLISKLNLVKNGGTYTTAGVASSIGVNDSSGSMQVIGAAGYDAVMTFHKPDAFAVKFGLGASNQLEVGGWSLGNNKYRLWTEQNFTPATKAELHGSLTSDFNVQELMVGAWIIPQNRNRGIYWSEPEMHLMPHPTDDSVLKLYNSKINNVGFGFYTSGDVLRGRLNADANGIGFLNSSNSWALRTDINTSNVYVAGSVTAGAEGFKTGAATIKYNTTTKSLDFNFA